MVNIMKSKDEELFKLDLPRKWERRKKVPWSFSSRISSNRRKDGKAQNKITLAKRFIDYVEKKGGFIEGTFSVETFDDGMQIFFDKEKLPETQALNELYTACWVPLTCPFCGKRVPPPLFKDRHERVSETIIHECGAEYFCDLEHSDLSWDSIPEVTHEETQWLGIIIHNYNILTSWVGYSLHNDFDMMNPSTMLAHVIFRVKKDRKIGKLGYTTRDIYGKSVTVLFAGTIRM